MSNMVQDRMAWMAARLKGKVGNTATFVRGAIKIPLTVTLGTQGLRVSDGQGGTKLEWTDLDIVIAASDLTPDNGDTVLTPQKNDRFYIDFDDGAGMQRFDAMPYDHNSAPFNRRDTYRKMIRIHTKAKGPQPVE